MGLSYRQIGVNADGTPHFTVESDSKNPHFVVTGPHAAGVVRLPDGMSYDVTAPVIEVESPEHAGQVGHLIAVQHEQASRHNLAAEPTYDDDGVLVAAPHECSDACGPLKTKHSVTVRHLGIKKKG